MAQFEPRPYIWAPEEYLLANGAGYHQFSVQREKTPGSLCNHTGHTPTPSGPLSTPHSRDNSQPPEQSFEHPPEPMNWEDGPDESYSTSPTSIRTPDDGSFDEEMQDAPQSMRDFYQYGEPSTQATEVDVMDFTALPPPGFSTPEVQAAFIDAAFSNFPQLNTQFMNSQNQLPPNPRMQMSSQLPYNQQYGTAYTRQHHQQEPWNSQVPPRMPNEPHSEVALFDPASDPERLSYLENWTANHTDPRILVSPSDPSVPPLDQYFLDPTTISPVQMEQTISSTSSFNGSYNGNFTYPPTQFFPETTYLHSSMSFPSPGISQQAHLSPILGAISPLASAPSPSSDVISSHTSDHGITLDNYPTDPPDTIRPPPSPVQVKINSPASTTPDRDAFGPEPPRQHHVSRASNRPGGRAVGTHLDAKVAKAAHDMRKIVACWHCVLQRDKCGPGDTCDRCLKRAQRPNTDCGLGCSRVKLIELTQYFLPPVVSSMHEDAQLTHFVSRHIRQWGNVEITIQMTAGQNGLPRIPVKVYEFLPATQELLWQVQYKTDPQTQKIYPVRKASPPLGMVHINHNEEKKYDRYVNEIVENHLEAFSRLAWGRDTNDFQEKLFGLLIRMTPRNDEETKLLREVFRLIVVTYIMGRTLTIAEEDKAVQLSKLHFHPGPEGYVQNFCSPRMTNRQLKYFFYRIHQSTLSAVLNKLQQIFKSSKGCDKWLAAFLAVIGLAMSFEEQQKTIHLIMQTQAKSGECTEEAGQNRAECTCREIDNKFMFVAQIFRWKYNRKCNPLRDVELEWEKEVGFADAGSVAFVRQVANLVKENTDFLSVRQSVSISGTNQSKYTSRLVGQFLLSFWLPS